MQSLLKCKSSSYAKFPFFVGVVVSGEGTTTPYEESFQSRVNFQFYFLQLCSLKECLDVVFEDFDIWLLKNLTQLL